MSSTAAASAPASDASAHDTRHTCASLLVALDVHPRIAMQILRHSEIAVTMEVYTRVPSADTRRALRKLGEALGGRSQKKTKATYGIP
ncbi:site-specific integrase [Streptomyces albogriseolus]|uniref:hypothetical protein n=1 Tax=Streptomyces albogriseolus TaxID=1887 RepID=UPI00368AD9BC